MLNAFLQGADLSHVICSPTAASAIKSYAPDLIVHPILREDSSPEKLKPELDSLFSRLHAIVIGPGLGREPYMQAYARLALSIVVFTTIWLLCSTTLLAARFHTVTPLEFMLAFAHCRWLIRCIPSFVS